MRQAEPTTRRRDIDRLRVLACLSTFIYHPLTVFDLGQLSHIKSATTSAGFEIASQLMHVVRMPLFFLIAGMVGMISIRRLTDREVLRQRAVRLLLPLVFGVILIAPVVKYFELLDGRNISWRGVVEWDGPPDDILLFLRRFYTQARWFTWSHLWFLFYLFVLGAALLPVMRWLELSKWPAAWPTALTVAFPLVLLVTVELALRPIYPFHLPNVVSDWASICVYLIAMVFGAALVRFPELEAGLRTGVVAFLVATVAGALLYLGFGNGPLHGLGRALLLWGVLCLLIGLGPRLSRGHIAGERYLAEAVLPLYVLHLLPLVVIAYFAKDLAWPLWFRYGFIVASGFVVTLTIHHFLVRPFSIMRVALGMPPRRPQARRQL